MKLLCLLILLLGYLPENEVLGSSLRVVGGYEAPKQFSKFHASLQNLSGSHVCGGAIVSKNHIVTAAHCLLGAEPEHSKVVVGTTDLDANNGQNYDVLTKTLHDKFDFNTKVDDIGILKIKGSFDMKYIQILKLYREELNDGDSIILTGFGAQEPNGETSRQMYALDLTVFNQETCKYAMRYVREVFDEMFCTFTQIGQGTCHGDSGGPLVKDDQLVGIVSWGIPCAVGFPDVHTRITPYITWIQEIINNN